MSKVTKIIALIRKQVKTFPVPIVTGVSYQEDPYKVLVSCLLSLRAKDAMVSRVSSKLFKAAKTPEEMVRLSRSRLEKIIYPVGFFHNKARTITEVSTHLISDFNGKVPDTLEKLLTLKGVGRKTANLVLGLAYHRPAICVDIHVHRITNRLGWVHTRDPFSTEMKLMNIIPKRSWIELNTVLVTFGQHICVPVSPFCSKCKVNERCEKHGVTRWR